MSSLIKWKSITQLISSNIVAQLLPLLILPVIARLYSEDEFGKLGLFSTAILVFGVIGSLRFDQLLYSFDKGKIKRSLIYGSAIVGILALFVVITARMIQFLTPLPEYFYLAVFSIAIFSLIHLYIPLLTVYGEFKCISISIIIKAIVVCLAQFGFYYVESISEAGLVYGVVAGLTAQLLYLALKAGRSIGFRFEKKEFIALVSNDKSFLVKGTLQSIFNSVSSNVLIIFISFMFSPIVLGLYVMAKKLVFLPVTFIGNSVRPLFLSSIKENIDNSNHASNFTLLKNTLKYGAIPALIGLLLMYYLAEDFFELYAGKNWRESGVYSFILAPWVFMAFLNIPSVSFLTAIKRMDVLLKYDAMLLIVRVCVLALGATISFSVLQLIAAYSLIGFLSNLLLVLYVLNMSRNLHEENVSRN